MKYSNLPRIFIPQTISTGNNITLSNDVSHYLFKVLRLKDNDELRIFNDKDGEFLGKCHFSKKFSEITVHENIRMPLENKVNISLACCLVKPEKMSVLIDMATQIGIDSFIPVISSRTNYKNVSLERFEKIAISAIEQSEQFKVPKFNNIISLKDLVNNYSGLIVWANENSNSKLNLSFISNAKELLVLIGPAGGFTDIEIDYLKSKNNVVDISLGDNVLRTETATIAILSQLKYLIQ